MMGHSHVVSGVAAGMALFGTAALSIPPLSAGGTVTTVPLGAGLGDLPSKRYTKSNNTLCRQTN